MESKFTLDSFELEFSKTDERLLIQAQEKPEGALLSKTITHDSAKALSQEHFLDPDMVYELLIDFFKNKQNKATLTLRNDGALMYACQVMYGRISKLLSFTIYLKKEEDQHQQDKLENLVFKLTERVSELEKRLGEKSKGNTAKVDFEKLIEEKFEKIDNLERIVTKNEERLKRLEEIFIGQSDPKKIEIQVKEYSRIDWTFNSTGSPASKYMFLNHNKTVIAKEPKLHTIFAKQALPKAKKTEIEWMIEGSSENMDYMAVGIASETSLGKNSCLEDKRTFLLTFGGFILINGACQSGSIGFAKGDKVFFRVDMLSGEASVWVNGKYVYAHTFSTNDRNSYEFYPCVVTNNKKGVGATFV